MGRVLNDMKLVAVTTKAKLIRHEDIEDEDAEQDENQWWVPLSLIEDTDLEKPDDVGFIEIPEWFCEKNGIEV